MIKQLYIAVRYQNGRMKGLILDKDQDQVHSRGIRSENEKDFYFHLL